MRLFWWQQIPLLILIQLFEPGTTRHRIYAEASLTIKSTVGDSRQPSGEFRNYPCPRQRASINCYKLKDRGLTSLFSLQAKILFSSRVLPSRSSVVVVGRVDGNSDVPTLTASQEGHDKRHGKKKIAAVVGGAVAALLVVVVVFLVYICLMRVKRFIRRTSDSASSMPSLPAEWERGDTSPYAVPLSPFETSDLRELTYTELEQATGNFGRKNIIGEGRFGLAYKGLLQDGSIVAVKRRQHPSTRSFHQVKQIARIQNPHLVRLIGYYHDSNQQLLVYDYLSNGNVGYHLYDSAGLPIGKLGIRQRLSIAVGAAKGLGHLHSLVPPVPHMHFRTRNVLLDENFTAKVSDFGLTKLLIEGNLAGSSSSVDYFLDPELDMQNNVSERSDVYSFGVFLLELISGREANNAKNQSNNSEESLLLQAKRREEFDEFVDKSLRKQATHAAKQMMELALACIDYGQRRPAMKFVAEELERIHDREMARLSSELDVQISSVTLGSELFK